MESFNELSLSKNLQRALAELSLEKPTPIQAQSYPVIMSGTDMVGIAQTGTGKTFAYLLPILQDLPFSKEPNPRVLILVPTRELVLQVVEEVEKLAQYMSVRVIGVFGGTNINRQKEAVAEGADIIVATPGRLYDLVLARSLQLKAIKKVVIDEVDVMLDLGFRFQLTNILDLLPNRRQNLMFSATMTDEVHEFIQTFFIAPTTVSVAVSGTPLDNIAQFAYGVPNFYTKVNLLKHLLQDENEFKKVLVFVPNKKSADLLFDLLDDFFGSEVAVIHSNKTQNYRLRSIENFNAQKTRILVTTDVMSRGLDLDQISHVVNIDVPTFPENYMHRIGRTGRAAQKGTALLFYSEKEVAAKQTIENLMGREIEELPFPKEVSISQLQTEDEKPQIVEINNPIKLEAAGPAFHEKKEKNKKVNQGGSYKRKIKQKYKKPKTRGDKNFGKNKRGK
ncbi:DEAD/DEAH box helicase [Vitellibacter sp. q18]|nr:DEAD/DEAH box helicase [Aequorivita lutea]